MNIALLFNSSHPNYVGNYYWATRRLVFQTGIIQRSDRHMKMPVGDVLAERHSYSSIEQNAVRNAVYFDPNWGRLHQDRLHRTFGRARVFAMVFENMPRQTGEALHETLSPDEGYLGFKAVEFSYGPHLVAFRNYLGTVYRLKGRSCHAFFSIDEDGKDDNELKAMRELGFNDVQWEDQGARKTIFDDFDTLDHFQQVATVREAITPFLPDGEDDAFELVMVLEDLNPQLFNALGAAVSAIAKARHEEHVAQAALSGRRYMEKLANALFAPRPGLYKGKDVGPDKYKNRLWAFIADNVESSDPRLEAIGTEVDRLVEELNGGIHGDRERERILRSLADAACLTVSLLALNLEVSRQPYAPFLVGVRRFF